MADNTNNLPYHKASVNFQKSKEKMLARFLLRKIKPRLKEKFPEHYLIQSIPYKKIKFVKEMSKAYPYFLKFDIRLYYPSICHKTLSKEIETIFGNSPSRRMKKHLKDIIPKYLNSSPYSKGISIGSSLSYTLGAILLLNLDLKIPQPFLRQTDDYIVFCKDKNEPEKILRELVSPELKRLKLEINEKKLKSGKFHKDQVDFIGFNFYAGHFTIKESKVNEFKNKIIKITHLTKKKPKEAIIKLLNNKIIGFGHYYKHASCTQDFQALDSFIRMRLRRYLSRNKDNKNKQGNLILTNEAIKSIGLKSLVEIKYGHKKRHISKKRSKKTTKSGRLINQPNWNNLEHIELKHRQEEILNQLKKLTSLVKKIEMQIVKNESKVVKKKKERKEDKVG